MICKECNKEFETLDSLRRHCSQIHKVTSEQTYVDYVLDGIYPVCKCGCNEKTKFLGVDSGFREYKQGHAARVNNNWGHNPNAIKKSHETQKKMYNSGKLTIWNKGLTIEDIRVKDNIDKVMSNPERGKNISKKLKGVKKSEEHIAKIKEHATIRWSSVEEREKQSIRRIKTMVNDNYKKHKTLIEIDFENILQSLGFVEGENYIYQHQISTALFDFYIINLNILIEVDGDFHHCNPNGIHRIPIYPIQIKTVGNDIRKNLIADNNNIKLIRFWEKDIKERPEWVINQLKSQLDIF
jgi:very-short-patch-repair endonuclease